MKIPSSPVKSLTIVAKIKREYAINKLSTLSLNRETWDSVRSKKRHGVLTSAKTFVHARLSLIEMQDKLFHTCTNYDQILCHEIIPSKSRQVKKNITSGAGPSIRQ